MQEYSKISLRILTIVLSTRGFACAPRFWALEIHWTAKCYELANKEAATWHENRTASVCPALVAGRTDGISAASVFRQPQSHGAFVLLLHRMTTRARRAQSSP